MEYGRQSKEPPGKIGMAATVGNLNFGMHGQLSTNPGGMNPLQQIPLSHSGSLTPTKMSSMPVSQVPSQPPRASSAGAKTSLGKDMPVCDCIQGDSCKCVLDFLNNWKQS